jgi:hypothetical protein
MTKNRFLNKQFTICFVLALTLWRAYTGATLPLHPDEAYYWLWSRHLALSYFDHPPMIAYLIKLSTVFSQSAVFWCGALQKTCLNVTISPPQA